MKAVRLVKLVKVVGDMVVQMVDGYKMCQWGGGNGELVEEMCTMCVRTDHVL